ncbi:tetratricopeptide repeat family protein, putative [Plasmodium gallinaceum]|uniref:Tetratricopeptide repeat family protein, putative n=1 Tax=Plasmodium gallinaceum TaxID=5849 RepID=A0A1J1GT79_PLAGA|nr:tetratricopeptide repeat family protein, putative [Plasmodium gallinaceum]CRG95716.1 tetratricopeptide repeat family protein, putative [Plasmodium gallinaceum]
MQELNLENINIKKVEESKNEGNKLFKNKKYKEALDIYLDIISFICCKLCDSSKVREVVNYFQKNCVKETNNLKEENESKNSCVTDLHIIKNNFVKVCHNISLCYYFLENYEKSTEYCLYINEIEKNHFKSYHTLGMCFEKLKDYKKSLNYYERCKVVLLKENLNENNKKELEKINEKLKSILNLMDKEKYSETTTIDNIKKIILDENSKEEEKIKMLHCIYNKKFYILLKENVFKFLFDVINKSDSIQIEKMCLYAIYKIISKMEMESIKIEKNKDENYKNRKICINKLDDLKFQFYYDIDFIKILISFNESFDENWINNYIKNKTKKLESLKFSKDEFIYKSTIDTLVHIINIIKYIYVINNENILKIINLYYLNSDNYEMLNNGINAVIFLCKKKKNLTLNSDKKKKTIFLEKLEKSSVDIKNSIVEFHFCDSYKYPVCVNTEIKKIIQNAIGLYDNFSNDVEYCLILLLTLLNDKNRPNEKDTEMNDLIYESIDLYFDIKEISIEWFVCVKCLFLVDKDIVLNYLIGKTEYMFQILNFINNSIGRKPKGHLSLYIDVLLLLLNISELRFMLNNYIDLYINILKTLNYDENFLKLLVGSFKLYMHNKDFKEEIIKNIDLFFYSKEMLKKFLLIYDKEIMDNYANPSGVIENNYLSKDKRECVDLTRISESLDEHNNLVCLEKNIEKDSLTKRKNLDKNSVIKNDENIKSKKNCELVCKNKKNDNTGYERMLKDIIEMLFYLSLHIEFKKQLLEEKNNYILFVLIRIGEHINKKKLDNTYKYIYCNTINNLILTRADEKMRRREINKANLSNFDNEQIEALEQFYDKLPNTAKPKIDPLYDYGDSDTSNKLISLLLYNEKYQNNINEKSCSDLPKITYKNGTIINTIYNFINSNFFTTNIAESVCDIISKFVRDTNNIGIVLVNNGLKALLLASKHINNKKSCIYALSEIFIYTNPKLIHFYEAYDSLPLLIDQMHQEEEFLVFKTLMAITNILTIDENIAVKAIQLNLWNKCFDILSSENDCLRSASLECICNLCAQSYVHQYIYDKYQKLVKGNEECQEINFVDIQIIYSFTLEFENYKAVFAATGALGMLSSDLRLPFYLIKTKGFNHIFSSFQKTNDQNILLRILTFFNNIILSENIPDDTIRKVREYVNKKEGLNEENMQISNLILQ